MRTLNAQEYNEYWRKVIECLRHHPRYRIGQAMSNMIDIMHQDIGNVVRGSHNGIDPYYADSPDDPRIIKFLDVITGVKSYEES
jgi:hypothetical protein